MENIKSPEARERDNETSIIVQPQQNSLQVFSFPTKEQVAEYEAFLENYNAFVDRQLKEGVDYGIIPGVEKPSLLKPGAEKLEKLFFYRSETIEKEKVIEQGYKFIKYTFTTKVYNKAGQLVATCDGTCNSKEKKYRYTTKFPNEITEEEKANAKLESRYSKKTGKNYNVYIIEKSDYYDIENTISKMAQKRSYVGVMLLATNSSGRFTQDVEDMAEFEQEAPVKQESAITGEEAQKSVKATPKQINFVKSLIKQKGQTDKVTDDQISQLTLTEAKKWIDKLLKMPDKGELPVIDIDAPYNPNHEGD